MKSLIKKTFNSKLGVDLRNLFGFHTVFLGKVLNESAGVSISDAFPWRTDKGYKTTFKYADILNLFYKIQDSYVELFFYTNENKLIKKIEIAHLDYSNELMIDKDFLNGIEGYGVFYIFHRCKDTYEVNLAISNKCYVGFSVDNCLNSFVHGMSYVSYQTIDGKIKKSGLVLSSFFKKVYRVQNSFLEFTKTELFFANPSAKKINFSIGKEKYSIEKGCSILIDIDSRDELSILSNSTFFRPIIFNYKDVFLDVHHG